MASRQKNQDDKQPAFDENSTAQLRELLESLPDMIFELDEDGHFTYVNQRAVTELGYSKKELFSSHFTKFIDKNDLNRVVEFFKERIKSKEARSYIQLEILRKDQSRMNLGLSLVFRIKDKRIKKISAIGRNITELIKARKKLAESEAKYRILSDYSRDLISLHEPNGKYQYISPSCEKLLGYSESELIGTDPFAIFHPDDHEKIIKHTLNQEKNGSAHPLEFRIQKKSGVYLWFESYSHLVKDTNGQTTAIQNTARDISRRKEQEFNLKVTDRKLSQYKEGLRLLNEIAANPNLTAEQQVNEALWVSAQFLQMQTGILSKITGDSYVIENTYGDALVGDKGDNIPLTDTFCEQSYKKKEPFALPEVGQTTFKVHPAHTKHGIGSYIGIPYYVSGNIRGTLNFLSSKARDTPFDQNEFEYLKLLSRWIGFTLQHKEHEQDLMADKMILQTFVSSAPAAIAMFDGEFRYIAASDKWYSDYGLEDEYIIGKTYFEVFSEVGQEWKEIFENAIKGNVEHNDQDLIERQNGDIKWIKWEIRPWYKKLEVVGGLIMFTEDISQQKEQQLQLKIAKRKAEQASKAKEQFLSTMSHEIRTPLNAIIGMTDVMLMDNPQGEQLKRINLLKFSGNNLLVLINDILDFNKIEAGKLELEIIDFNLKSLLEQTRDSLHNLSEKKGLELNLNYDPSLPEFVKGDATRIGQIITNLVNNAIKFTEEGYVSLKCRLLHKERDNFTIKFEIKDTGIGIPRDKIDTIFQSFEQARADITRKYGGSGLGLAITKKLLGLMRSNIQVQSSEGFGSIFYFEITLPQGEATNVIELPGETATDTVKESLNILVAEDNEGNRILIESLFKRWKINLTFAENGQIAVEKIVSKEFDMVFMDLQMPVMDGYESTRLIRAMDDTYFKEIPIIALTASVMSNVLDKTRKVGMNAYITKPFDPNHLKNIIGKYSAGLSAEKENKPDRSETFPYLAKLFGNDQEAINSVAVTSLNSIKQACEGITEGLHDDDLTRVKRELHVLRPNLFNLELGQLVENHQIVNQLDSEMKQSLEILLENIENELTSDRFEF